MKKNVWKLVGAVLILVVLIIGYVAVTILNPEETEETQEQEDTSIEVNTFESDDVTELSYTSKKGDFTFLLDGESWYYTKDKNCPIDQAKITAMLSAASSVKASQLVEENNKENFSSFGLDEPTETITYKLSSGESKTYYVGDYNEMLTSYYFNVKGEDKVYLIDTTLFNSFDYDLLGLVDVEEYPIMSATDISDFSITNGKKTVYTKDKNDAAHKKNDSEIPAAEWVSGTNKNKLTAVGENFADDVIQSIVGLTNSGCVEYDCKEKDLKKYGLDKPLYKLVVNYTETKLEESKEDADTENTATPAPSVIVDKQLVVYIGSNAESGEYYVKMEGSSMVNTMNVSGIENILALVNEEE